VCTVHKVQFQIFNNSFASSGDMANIVCGGKTKWRGGGGGGGGMVVVVAAAAEMTICREAAAAAFNTFATKMEREKIVHS